MSCGNKPLGMASSRSDQSGQPGTILKKTGSKAVFVPEKINNAECVCQKQPVCGIFDTYFLFSFFPNSYLLLIFISSFLCG